MRMKVTEISKEGAGEETEVVWACGEKGW